MIIEIRKRGFALVLIILIIWAINFQVVATEVFSLDKSTNSSFGATPELRNIMLTGYWNPTGQMIAQFSNDSYLNPDGWKGANWEGWGFNIYSFFPNLDVL